MPEGNSCAGNTARAVFQAIGLDSNTAFFTTRLCHSWALAQ
jgi:hypothetical protein